MLRYVLSAGAVAALASSVFAGIHADSVVSYTPGAISATYQTPSAALGELSPTMNFAGSYQDGDGNTVNFLDDSILTPFNAAYNPDQIVGIGAGGALTLHLSETAATNGKTLGVHTASGLIDLAWPSGQNLPQAANYTDPRVAEVRVAKVLGNWVSLGVINFENPSNYYSQGITNPGSDSTAGTALADFSQPFLGKLADFDNQDWNGTLDVLNGSAGGQWLDLSGTGLDGVNYVQFVVAPGASDLMYVDAVSAVAVPEPASLAMLVVPMLLMKRRRA